MIFLFISLNSSVSSELDKYRLNSSYELLVNDPCPSKQIGIDDLPIYDKKNEIWYRQIVMSNNEMTNYNIGKFWIIFIISKFERELSCCGRFYD